jgi:Tn3 transposase DDE domain
VATAASATTWFLTTICFNEPLHDVWILGRSLYPGFLAGEQVQGSAGHDSCRHTRPKHSDFGLAFLLGIELMPRIRNWKDQHLFRPTPDVSYEHIDELFSAQVDWDLIATLLPDMMRVGGIDSNRQHLAFRYSPTTQQRLAQKQALFRVPRTGPSSQDDFLIALSFRCRAAPHDSGGH